MTANQGDDTLWQQVVALAQAGDLKGALAALDQLVMVEPGNVRAHYNRGVLFQRLGQPVEAAAAYRRVLSLDPTHAKALRALQALGGQVPSPAPPAPAQPASGLATASPSAGPAASPMPPLGSRNEVAPPHPPAARASTQTAVKTPCPNHPDHEALAQCARCGRCFCPNCLLVLRGMKYCPPCREQVLAQPEETGPKPRCKEAYQALLIALVGLVIVPVILQPIAIAKALRARQAMRINPRLEGSTNATAALIIGSVSLAISLLVLFFLIKFVIAMAAVVQQTARPG